MRSPEKAATLTPATAATPRITATDRAVRRRRSRRWPPPPPAPPPAPPTRPPATCDELFTESVRGEPFPRTVREGGRRTGRVAGREPLAASIRRSTLAARAV